MRSRRNPKRRSNLYSLSAMALLAGMGSARAEEIRIAVAGPMTGPVATIGEQLKNGAELAAQAINKNGGVNGNTIKIIVYDDACDPKQAVAVANRIGPVTFDRKGDIKDPKYDINVWTGATYSKLAQ